MKLYAILICNADYQLIYSNYNLVDFSFIFRDKIKNNINSTCYKIVRSTSHNSFYQIHEIINNISLIIYGAMFTNNYIIITNNDYDKYQAYELLRILTNTNLTKNDIDKLFETYSDKIENEKILLIKQELDVSKIILFETANSIAERALLLDDLIDKSSKLVDDSFVFKKKADNNCCNII